MLQWCHNVQTLVTSHNHMKNIHFYTEVLLFGWDEKELNGICIQTLTYILNFLHILTKAKIIINNFPSFYPKKKKLHIENEVTKEAEPANQTVETRNWNTKKGNEENSIAANGLWRRRPPAPPPHNRLPPPPLQDGIYIIFNLYRYIYS